MNFKTIIIIGFVLVVSLLNTYSQQPDKTAEQALMEKDYATAIDKCRLILESDPGRTDISIILGMALQGMQDYQSALDVYHTITTDNDISVKYLKAECFEILGDVNSAIEIYSGILLADSADFNALSNCARISLKRKDYSTAIKFYEKLLITNPDNYLFLKNLGTSLYQCQQELVSLPYFSRAWNLNKKDLNLPVNIANVHMKLKDAGSALDILFEGLSYDTTNIQILKTAAYINYIKQDYETSADLFNRAFLYGDSTAFLQKYLGLSLFEMNNFEEAIPHLKSFYLSDTLNSEASYMLGLAMTTWHYKTEGITFLEKTLELMMYDPEFMGSVNAAIGAAWLDINDREMSLLSYTQAHRFDPSKAYYIFEMAKIHDYNGKYKNDVEQYKLAITEYERYISIETVMAERMMAERGIDGLKVVTPGITYSKSRIKIIREELFFLGEIDNK